MLTRSLKKVNGLPSPSYRKHSLSIQDYGAAFV